jgi:hypothetical protein
MTTEGGAANPALFFARINHTNEGWSFGSMKECPVDGMMPRFLTNAALNVPFV